MKFKNIFLFAALSLALTACEDLFEPAKENNRNVEDMLTDPNYATGLLGYGYAMLPYDNSSVSDVATDDAVTNDKESSYSKMALGAWTANNNPMEQWQARKAVIQYLNTFLGIVGQVSWSDNPVTNQMFIDKLSGETYALRALNNYYLLMAHAGRTADGRLLGVPMPETSEDWESTDFNQERPALADCIQKIFTDLDKAAELLPLDYANIDSDAAVPEKYKQIGAKKGNYDLVFGTYQRGRISTRIVEAIKAQVALWAASPAYRDASGVTSAQAADLAAVVLDRIGGVDGLDKDGHIWFNNATMLDNLGSGEAKGEILWRGNKSNGTEDWDMGIIQEKNNFPPTLYGSGRINPTQNLVDAFPMADGSPIDKTNPDYLADPYANRDPRLSLYVIYNGADFKGKKIITGTYPDADKSTDNGLNQLSTSTRTGYYLRKLLREDCNPDPNSLNAKYHIPVRIRYTEIFLAYAEAANDAWGSEGTGTHTYSAYDVIKAIRERAGITNLAYLKTCKGNQVKMAELIRNERRIELCFENKRFWDLRRWNLPLDETAMGVEITNNSGTLTYTPIQVEERKYKDYMMFGPIPYGEILKWDNLEQNKGW